AHLADAEAELRRIGGRVAVEHRQAQRVQRRLAVAVRPPEPRVVNVELWELSGREVDRADARPGRDRLLDRHVVEGGAHPDAAGLATAGLGHVEVYVGDIRAREREVCDDLRVEDAHRPHRLQLDGEPQPGVAVADAGYPVPALGRDEGRAVDGQLPAVLADTALDGLLVRDARVRRRLNAHGDDVLAHGRGDVELATDEGAHRAAEQPPVEPDL